ncbi:MAG: thioredoxin family protein, partial [candidate division WOR-3 bacterium]
PCLVVAGEKDYGIRFYGVPAGFEFTTLLNTIQLVGRRESGLRPETRQRLAELKEPLDISVFVTLTCPYCPMMAHLAHRFAFESDKVTASVIDAGEFPVLANLHNVTSVPKTVVNRQHHFEGAMPEERFLSELLRGIQQPA